MAKHIGSAILFSCALIAASGYADESQTFNVTGKVITVGPDFKIVDGSSGGDSQEDHTDGDPRIPIVAITRKDTNAQGMLENIEVVSGSFEDGEIALEGMIEEPSNLLITVEGISNKPVSVSAVAAPGDSFEFVLLHYESPRYNDELLLVEDSRLVEDSEAMFTVWGDLCSITDKDLSVTIAELEIRSSGTQESVVISSEAVLLRDGKFSFEGIAKEPLLFAIDVWTVELDGLGRKYRGIADLVVEPGARIRISPSKSSSSFHKSFASELVANSETAGSMHTKVVESWQNSSDYLEKMDQYATAIQNEQKRQATDSTNETTDAETEGSNPVEDDHPDPYEIYQQMEGIKSSTLSSIARNMDEPMAALLAMELGAPEAMQVEMWDKFESELDQDLFERRVLPRREARETQISLTRNAELIVEGHIAPQFTLANLEGEEIALSDVLADNEVVLVDFWASWCGPCIAQIPKLKELHSGYKDDGFEIVFVSIDEEYDDWKGESDRQDLPWINVGDLKGWHAPTAVEYGVQWVPTEFAIQADGEILDRELTTAELEEFLADRFDRSLTQENVED